MTAEKAIDRDGRGGKPEESRDERRFGRFMGFLRAFPRFLASTARKLFRHGCCD
jgi:hypothetical protein